MKRRPWTEQDIATLRRLYASTPTTELAEHFGRGLRAVYDKAMVLGLKKSPHYLHVHHGARAAVVGTATRFVPGQKPWNKGTHYVAGGRSVETRFSPGNTPYNWAPVGSYRINRDGYLDRKVSDERRGARDWEAVHRLIWKEAHGEIPPNHVVAFRPGRKSIVLEEITLDALELVSRQEMIRRNTIHRYPEDVKAAIRQLGVLHRRINERTKHEESNG